MYIYISYLSKEIIIALSFFEGGNTESSKQLSSRNGNKKITMHSYLIYLAYKFYLFLTNKKIQFFADRGPNWNYQHCTNDNSISTNYTK